VRLKILSVGVVDVTGGRLSLFCIPVIGSMAMRCLLVGVGLVQNRCFFVLNTE
jgi:hypothetical protein